MKIISLILLVISLSCKTPVAQYDNPPQPILEEIREEEKEIFIGTLVTPPLPYLASSNDKSSNFSTQKSY